MQHDQFLTVASNALLVLLLFNSVTTTTIYPATHASKGHLEYLQTDYYVNIMMCCILHNLSIINQYDVADAEGKLVQQ